MTEKGILKPKGVVMFEWFVGAVLLAMLQMWLALVLLSISVLTWSDFALLFFHGPLLMFANGAAAKTAFDNFFEGGLFQSNQRASKKLVTQIFAFYIPCFVVFVATAIYGALAMDPERKTLSSSSLIEWEVILAALSLACGLMHVLDSYSRAEIQLSRSRR